MPTKTITTEDAWSAIDSIGCEDGYAHRIPPHVTAKLIELRLVKLDKAGFPLLTASGRKAFTVLESGNGKVRALDGLPSKDA
jgi:hypothetical protein